MPGLGPFKVNKITVNGSWCRINEFLSLNAVQEVLMQQVTGGIKKAVGWPVAKVYSLSTLASHSIDPTDVWLRISIKFAHCVAVSGLARLTKWFIMFAINCILPGYNSGTAFLAIVRH